MIVSEWMIWHSWEIFVYVLEICLCIAMKLEGILGHIWVTHKKIYDKVPVDWTYDNGDAWCFILIFTLFVTILKKNQENLSNLHTK